METIKRPSNFRDLGGLKSKTGKQVLSQKLLRSGELVRLTDSDKVLLKSGFGLKTVIDFRTSEEIKVAPDEISEGTQYCHVDLLDNSLGKTGSLHDLQSGIKPEFVDHMMKEIYQRLITDDCARKGYRKFLQILLNQKEGSILFHCFAGKDRTGIAAAIILEILEVPREEIYNDYLKTNEQRVEENKMMIEAARKQGVPEESLCSFEAALLVKKDYLECAFLTAEQEFGSFRKYVCEGIGLKEDETERLKNLYLI